MPSLTRTSDTYIYSICNAHQIHSLISRSTTAIYSAHMVCAVAKGKLWRFIGDPVQLSPTLSVTPFNFSVTPLSRASAARFQIEANGCGYAQGPFWLPRRIALVGQENQIEDIRFFFSPLTQIQHCLCREVDEIWQYCTGGSLTTFDKDHGTVEEGARSKVLAAKHTASLQLLCQSSEIRYFEISQRGVQCTVVAATNYKTDDTKRCTY